MSHADSQSGNGPFCLPHTFLHVIGTITYVSWNNAHDRHAFLGEAVGSYITCGT